MELIWDKKNVHLFGVAAAGGAEDEFLNYLLFHKLLGAEQAEILKIEMAETKRPLEQLVVQLGFLSESSLVAALGSYSGYPVLQDLPGAVDWSLAHEIPTSILQQHRIFPLAFENGRLQLAMVDPYDVQALDRARAFFFEATVVTPSICRLSQWSALMMGLVEPTPVENYGLALMPVTDSGAIDQQLQDGSQVTELLQNLLFHAVQMGASDLHFVPSPSVIRILFRIDGVLEPVRMLHRYFWQMICVRLKIMGEMNITESRRPQSGRFQTNFYHRTFDCRISIHPTEHGESVVIRILDQSTPLRTLAELGYNPAVEQLLQQALEKPAGLILVTGPTGSGKTTSLYAMVQALQRQPRNIMTLEDPIEYSLPLIRQSQVGDTGMMSFAEGIRSLLRQDPDVLLVGEIRDPETAQMALRAAMTGHPVLTTLHTRSARGALQRLEELGLSHRSLAQHLTAIISQRLVRCLCPTCRAPQEWTAELDALFPNHTEAQKLTFFQAVGCEHCRHTGYRGRLAVAEALYVDGSWEGSLEEGGTEEGMWTQVSSLGEAALAAVREGQTSLAEIRRVLGWDILRDFFLLRGSKQLSKRG